MSENTKPNQLVTDILKDTIIVVDDKNWFIETEKKLFEKWFYWYWLDLVIPKSRDWKNWFINFKDNVSHLELFEKFKYNSIIIPVGLIDWIKDFTGMTISSINDIPYLAKERWITKVIHYLDLDKILNKCV